MNEHEKKLSIYIVDQIRHLLKVLCNNCFCFPKYKIKINFEHALERNMYVFNENFQYKVRKTGKEVIIDDENDFWIDNKEPNKVLLEDLKMRHEFVFFLSYNNHKITLIFDTLHKPYETLFFNSVILSYLRTKEIAIQKLLDPSAEEIEAFNKWESIRRMFFYRLNCDYEVEFILSRAVSEYFNYYYRMDVNLITALSCEEYEGNSNICTVYIPRKYMTRGKRHDGLTIKLKEKIEFNFNEMRRIRKYMEIGTKQLSMVLDKNKEIIGYTNELPRKYEGRLEVNGKLNWKFYIGNLELVYSSGVYRIFDNFNKKEDFYIDLHNIPLFISNRQKETISKIIRKSQEQLHGTAIIFGNSEQIKDEARRLAFYNRCIKISPVNLNKNINALLNITSIDGAILVDFNGKCYAIGAILDGDMAMKGNIERGARYNSTVNYIKRQNQKGHVFLAVIISEDKTIDIYPFSGTVDTK